MKRSNILSREEKDEYETRMDIMQEEFSMSDLEVSGILEFMHTLPKDMCPKDVLEEMIKSENLNIRQKVAFSHSLGILRAEEYIVGIGDRTIVIDIPEFPS